MASSAPENSSLTLFSTFGSLFEKNGFVKKMQAKTGVF